MDFLLKIKDIKIIEYARCLNFTLIKKGKYYSLKEHDSVMIDPEKNCFWRNSVFQKGQKGGAGSIIDFAIMFGGCHDVRSAMRSLAMMYNINGDKQSENKVNTASKYVKSEDRNRNTSNPILPQKGKNNNEVIEYLLERSIDLSVIQYFIKKQMLYEDKRKNCVFVSHNKKFACIRSTQGNRFLIDVSGSDYEECFYFRGRDNAKTLIATESVIDTMSIMTYFIRNNGDFNDYCYLALSGTNKLPSLFHHIDEDSNINKIMLALDNDRAGQLATESAICELKHRKFAGQVINYSPPSEKDWNDFIKIKIY